MNKVSRIIKSHLVKNAPFRSPKQEVWMWINLPDIAKKWHKEHGHAPGYSKYLKEVKRKRKRKRRST